MFIIFHVFDIFQNEKLREIFILSVILYMWILSFGKNFPAIIVIFFYIFFKKAECVKGSLGHISHWVLPFLCSLAFWIYPIAYISTSSTPPCSSSIFSSQREIVDKSHCIWIVLFIFSLTVNFLLTCLNYDHHDVLNFNPICWSIHWTNSYVLTVLQVLF